MTGAPYPRGTAGSGGIGQSFAIGISPIGEVEPFDEWTTVLSQYANSPVLTSMIESFNAAMDQTENIDNLFDMVWNILTASGWGLDVLGRIVGVTRALAFPGSVTFLGFDEAGGSDITGFNQGGFFSGGGTTTNFLLDDSNFRLLILAKAAGNISDGAIPTINAILLALFPGRGDCYVQDGLNMTLTYTFNFTLTTVEQAIVAQSGVLPNPAGVVINVSHL